VLPAAGLSLPLGTPAPLMVALGLQLDFLLTAVAHALAALPPGQFGATAGTSADVDPTLSIDASYPFAGELLFAVSANRLPAAPEPGSGLLAAAAALLPAAWRRASAGRAPDA